MKKPKREPLTIDAYFNLYKKTISVIRSYGFGADGIHDGWVLEYFRNIKKYINGATSRWAIFQRYFIKPSGKVKEDNIPNCFTMNIKVEIFSDLQSLIVSFESDDGVIVSFDMFETLKADGKQFPTKELSDLIARKIKSADEFLKEIATNKLTKEEYLAYLNVVRKIRFMYACKVGFGKNDIFSLRLDDENEYGIKCEVASRTWGWDDNPDGAWSIFDEKQIRIKPELDIDWNG